MTDAVLTEKDGHTLVGWDENFRKRVHQRKKSKCTSELHFFSLICLTCIFAGAHPKLEYKSSLVTWMSDNYILAFDHTDSFQVIWVEEKKSLGIHQTFHVGVSVLRGLGLTKLWDLVTSCHHVILWHHQKTFRCYGMDFLD